MPTGRANTMPAWQARLMLDARDVERELRGKEAAEAAAELG